MVAWDGVVVMVKYKQSFLYPLCLFYVPSMPRMIKRCNLGSMRFLLSNHHSKFWCRLRGDDRGQYSTASYLAYSDASTSVLQSRCEDRWISGSVGL
jgi:hypothetical protein